MFVNATQYHTDMLVDTNNIRYALCIGLYNSPSCIDSIKEIISRYIECNNIEFDPSNYSFSIKIKKTAMRKNRDFRHNPEFYYPIASNIFREFISNNSQAVIDSLSSIYGGNAAAVLDTIKNNHNVIANLCYLTCISDNIVIIKL